MLACPPSSGVESINSTEQSKLSPKGLQVKLKVSSTSISVTSKVKVLVASSSSSSSKLKVAILFSERIGKSFTGFIIRLTLAILDSRLVKESVSISSTQKNKLSLPLKSRLGV